MSSVGRVYVGTSGWNFKEWKGRFYPKHLKTSEWLRFLGTQLNTVEVNYSFYRMPSEESVENWRCSVSPDFRFAVKLWRGITHYRKLVRCEDFLERYFRIMEHVPPRQRGPLLIQLPPNQSKDVGKLDRFLDQVRERSPRRWRVAVEFRHDSWLTNDVYRLLNRQRAAICLHDMAGRGAATEPNHAKFVYIRRHGTEGKYLGGYSGERLQQDSERIRGWVKQGKDVFVYFNNDIGGHAAEDAQRLRDILKDLDG